MRKLNKQEKNEAAHMLAMLVVLLRVIDHMIIEAEKNAKWMQAYGIRTKLLIDTLRNANKLINKATCKLHESVYHQVDNVHIYSVYFDDIKCKKNYSEVHQYSYKLNMDSFDNEVNRLAEGAYHFITGGTGYGD